MATVKENLIAARRLLSEKAVFIDAYRSTGSAVGWAFDEVTQDETEVRAMFEALGTHWTPYRGDHDVLLGSLDRAIAAQESQP